MKKIVVVFLIFLIGLMNNHLQSQVYPKHDTIFSYDTVSNDTIAIMVKTETRNLCYNCGGRGYTVRPGLFMRTLLCLRCHGRRYIYRTYYRKIKHQ